MIKPSPRLNWKFKSFIFFILSLVPKKGGRILFLVQKIRGRPSKKIKAISQNWLWHEENVKKYTQGGTLFEFGAGITLGQNLYLSKHFDKQFVFDLYPMFDATLSNRAALMISEKTKINHYPIKNISDLKSYGIVYYPRGDARQTNLDAESVDFCASTNTLEHIPREDIVLIFEEIFRVMKSSGVVSVKIDYTDHYSHTDSSIHKLNFLKYDEGEWVRYNHKLHYQNRLRHSDYQKIFQSLGFVVILSESHTTPIDFEVASDFKDYQEGDVNSISGYFLLGVDKC